jgi:thiamine pyrophosphate-dependent acetolactate synthase large subunit-like protein
VTDGAAVRASGSQRPVAQGIVEKLAAAGVREVFSVAGGALTPLIGAFAAQQTIRYVGVRHEFAASTMAAAVYHGTGRLAACLGEQGPGSLNLVSGLGVAHNNNLPLIAITVSGPSRTAFPGSGALMELDAVLLTRAVTKWQFAVRQPEEAIPAVVEAIKQATTGRPGPVHIDIPRDMIGALVGSSDPIELPDSPAAVIPDVAEALDILLAAERPLVIAGGGAAHAEASSVLRRVAAHLGAATATTQMGIGVLASDGGTFAGQGGVIGGPALIRAAIEADVVLAVGCRFSSWWWRDGERLTKNARLVQIDVDPAAIAASGPAVVGLLGDARSVLDALWAPLAALPARPVGKWVRDVNAELLQHRARLELMAEQVAPPAHPAALARELAAVISPTDLVVLDGGHTTFWSNDFVAALEPRTVFHEPGMGHLGFGVPYANALAVVQPERRVVTITGDGAFGFSLIELDTARRLGLRTITVIHDNALWGIISLAQRHDGFSLGTDLSGTDYAAIANGFGCLGIRVENVADFPAAYEKALASELPAVIDVVVRFEPHPTMPDFGRTVASPAPVVVEPPS